jgi:hypothetical protein
MTPSFPSHPWNPVLHFNDISGGLCSTRRKYPEIMWRHFMLSYVLYRLALVCFGDRRCDQRGDSVAPDVDAETDAATDVAPQVVMVSGGCALFVGGGVEGWVGLHHFHYVLHYPCVGNAVCIFVFYQYPFWFFVSVYVVLLFNFFTRVLLIIYLVKLLNLFVRLMIWLNNQLMRGVF